MIFITTRKGENLGSGREEEVFVPPGVFNRIAPYNPTRRIVDAGEKFAGCTRF